MLPHTTAKNKRRFRLELLPEAVANAGTTAKSRDKKTVPDGVMSGWTPECVKSLSRPALPVQRWTATVWDASDEAATNSLKKCDCPDEVDGVLPGKFLPHVKDLLFSEKISKFCHLCTALVNKYLRWSSDDPELMPKTASEWRRMEIIAGRVAEVVQLLETTLGESVTPVALADPTFVEHCYMSLTEEDQVIVESILEEGFEGTNENVDETDAL